MHTPRPHILAHRNTGTAIERVRMPALDRSSSLPEWLARLVLLAMHGRCPFVSRDSLGEEGEGCLGEVGRQIGQCGAG